MYRQHVSSQELLAFALDGDPLPSVFRQHLDCCPSCQIRVARYQNTAGRLSPLMYRSRCPSATTLSYYCLPGALPEHERRPIAEHLAHCPLCAHELAETRAFLQVC